MGHGNMENRTNAECRKPEAGSRRLEAGSRWPADRLTNTNTERP